jgi:hypothetical protein
MWLESIIEYEAAPGAGPHANGGNLARAKPAFPAAPPGVSYGPHDVYGFPFTVKKTYTVGVKIGRRLTKRLGYTNPYTHELRLTLHTDQPKMLHLPKLLHVIPPGEKTQLRLEFEPRPQRVDNVAEPQLQIRLWVHNEGSGENEECIAFNLSYLTAFETAAQVAR